MVSDWGEFENTLAIGFHHESPAFAKKGIEAAVGKDFASAVDGMPESAAAGGSNWAAVVI